MGVAVFVGVAVTVRVLLGVSDGASSGTLVGNDVLVGRGVFVPTGFGVLVRAALPTSYSTQPVQPGMVFGLPPAPPMRIIGSAPLNALSPNTYA